MMKIDLTPRFEDFIERQVAGGRFQDASEVVQAALQLLERDEADRAEALGEVKRKIQESIKDPRPSIPADEVFAELRAQLRQRKAEAG